jgi:hypothetical protein
VVRRNSRRVTEREGIVFMAEVGTARCAVRAAYQRRNVGRDSPSWDSFRPLYGRGHRSAMSLPDIRRIGAAIA